MRDQITDGETGFLIDADEPGELRARVEFVLEDSAVRRSIGERARLRIQRENDPMVVSNQLEAFLADLYDTVQPS